MASTYSSLKIQLMGTGENSGTWGTITNTNLGTALEEAIVGSADVNFSSADVTLTLTNTNASQSARNLRLNLTGSVGAPQNLIVPAIEKIYIINNGLTQTITVKNASGTGISVPAGKTEYVYNNGTNVVEAINHLTSLTIDTPLPITSGGTGTNSTTYANLQSNVSGILPVANGGTGSNSATFSGANITSLNASAVSSGTLSNDRTTGSSANGANTIVLRDASGDFSADIITANGFTGSGANLTSLNGSSVSSGTVATARLGSGSPSSSNFLRGDGTWAAPSGGLTGPSRQVFSSSGTFTVPAGVTSIDVLVIGGGGNGGNVANQGGCESATGGGGGGGGAARSVISVTPGQTISVTVGGATGTSSFSTLSATGGGNGQSVGRNVGGQVGNSGVGSGGTFNWTAAGASYNLGFFYSGCSTLGVGPMAGIVGGFAPQQPSASSSSNGNPGNGPGCGGSGAATVSPARSGGAGASGAVIVEW